jgi:regulation of enolase protein 1 (concanavalin A-like superfamily)
VVVTDRFSDWSVVRLADAGPSDPVAIRLTRHGDAVRVQFSIGDKPWQLARLAPFSAEDARIGVMACSPERSGFRAMFRELVVGAAIPRDLHAG